MMIAGYSIVEEFHGYTVIVKVIENAKNTYSSITRERNIVETSRGYLDI